MTADCLPVLFTTVDGTEVGAAHGGWRGLCHGVLQNTLAHFKAPKSQIMAWLGPAIGPNAFEVGAEVHLALLKKILPLILHLFPIMINTSLIFIC